MSGREPDHTVRIVCLMGAISSGLASIEGMLHRGNAILSLRARCDIPAFGFVGATGGLGRCLARLSINELIVGRDMASIPRGHPYPRVFERRFGYGSLELLPYH